MIKSLARHLFELVDLNRLRARAEIINSLERQYGQENFARSAACCEQFLRADGFAEIQNIKLPCDGVTTYLDSTMPQAWDRTGRSYAAIQSPSLPEEESILCDTNETPFALGMWSAPTPPEGITAQVVDYDDTLEDLSQLQGKIVLIIGAFKAKLLTCVEQGAAGVLISDIARPDLVPNDYRWCNGVGRVGWYPVKEDKRIPALSLCPKKANFLRELIKNEKNVTLHYVVNTRIFDGEISTVTGIIPGEDKKEIVLLSHIYEPFLCDDATGAMEMLEVVSAICKLIKAGVLIKPRHTIRVLISMELYGFSAWFAQKSNVQKTCHVFSFDSSNHLNRTPDGFMHNRSRNSFNGALSFVDWVIDEAMSEFSNVKFGHEIGNLSDDTFVSGPLLKIPVNWLHNSDPDFHHNTSSHFNDVDWDLAQIVIAVMGTAVASLSCLKDEDYEIIGSPIVRRASEDLRITDEENEAALKKGDISASFVERRNHFLTECNLKRLLSFFKIAISPGMQILVKRKLEDGVKLFREHPQKEIPKNAAEKEAAKWVFTPLVPGVISSRAKVPYAERTFPIGFPEHNAVYGFCDGKHSLLEVLRATEYTFCFQYTEAQVRAAITYFKTLVKYQYLTEKRR